MKIRRWRVSLRGNFGTFLLLEVSPTIASVCVIIITCIVSPASLVCTTRKRGQSTNRPEQNIWRTKWARLYSESYFCFSASRRCFTKKFWAAQLFFLIWIFQSDRGLPRLNKIHAGPRAPFEIEYRKRACLTACPILFYETIISVKFHKKTSHSHARPEAYVTRQTWMTLDQTVNFFTCVDLSL